MGGVTILQTIPQYESTWGWSWGALILGIFAIILLVGAIVAFCDAEWELGILAVIFSMLFVAGTLVVASIAKQEFTHNQYQVLIDESVSMTEFTEKYNVIEQQGITYIVEEKVSEYG